jgi:hypothetical protein
MQKITPFLWFDNNAEPAVKFYTSIFKNSKTGRIARYPEGSPGPVGSVMTIEFEIEGLAIRRLERRPSFQIHRSNLPDGELRHTERDRRLLAEANRRRRQRSRMRLVKRQVRTFLANRSPNPCRHDDRQGPRKVTTRDDGAQDEET